LMNSMIVNAALWKTIAGKELFSFMKSILHPVMIEKQLTITLNDIYSL
jgi:hypothetical protein